MAQLDTDLTLVMHRAFVAPRELVFQGLTDPTLLARWWGPNATAEVDLNVNGNYRWAMKLANGMAIAAHGRFLAIEPPGRLVCTFAWEGEEAAPNEVTFALSDLGGITEMVVTHRPFPTEEARTNHIQGWNDCLSRLEGLLRELTNPVVAETAVAAAPDLVWHAWTHTERVALWFAPAANVEAKLGGAYELFFDPSNHDSMSTKGCTVTFLEPQQRLGFTWKGPDQFAAFMNQPGRLTGVLVTLRPVDGGTFVRIEHGGWGEGEAWAQARKWHEMAWSQVTKSLKGAMESGKGDLCCQPEA